MKHGNLPYEYWELMTACVARVLMNASYEDMKYYYGIPRSTMTINLRKICLSLQCRNTRQLQQRMKTGEVSRSNIREVIHQYVKKYKVGRPTYLILYEETLVVTAAYIEGNNGLPIYTAII